MNILEREMIEILKELRDEYGCFQIKAEFEAEGARMEELMRLKDITAFLDLPIIMKIGGVESVTDAYNCLLIGVASIIAPMVETPFALQKYISLIDKMIAKDNAEDIDFYFNMETITSYNNFSAMLEVPGLEHIDGVTVGRSDLAGSLNLDRSAVDSEQFLDICRNTFKMARAKGLACGLGGTVSARSIDFIKTLNSEKLLDKFETRKVVFHADAAEYGEIILRRALEFELLWLKSKRRYYSRVKVEDENRIEILEKRLKS
ncbi:MAG: citrate lyase beta subunit [Lentisphaeria bacterium]|nr:citrate lyase beta subunit [Lentisphaeria bacterium]